MDALPRCFEDREECSADVLDVDQGPPWGRTIAASFFWPCFSRGIVSTAEIVLPSLAGYRIVLTGLSLISLRSLLTQPINFTSPVDVSNKWKEPAWSGPPRRKMTLLRCLSADMIIALPVP